MIELTPAEIAAACGAQLVSGDVEARAGDRPGRAVVDSRLVEPGDFFFGLPGEHVNGGEFAALAIRSGAWGVVVSPAQEGAPFGGGPARVFVTEDPLWALGALAARWLESLRQGGCRVVGITGSTGKTSTKDILISMVDTALEGRAHANRENFNTEIGLPLTVLEASQGTRALVLEMAMRGMGQIRALARIARPDVGVITNVGPVHLELVGDLEQVAQAKAELIAELHGGATCVVPAADEALRPHLRSDVRVITFAPANTIGTFANGFHDDDALAHVEAVAAAGADVRALSADLTGTGLRADIVAGNERAVFEFSFDQAHNLTNALAAVAAGHALGIPLEALAKGARNIRFSSLRGEEVEVPGGALIINDCYNANPVSMRAAIDHLSELAARRRARRVVAVLGEMRELGPEAERFHEEVGAHAANSGVEVLIAVGPPADGYLAGFGDAGEVHRVGDADEAAELVRGLVGDGDIVLVKASRAVGLERVARALI